MDEWNFDAIGTRWQIDTRTTLDDAIRSEILRCVEDFDRTWSRFRADSVVSDIARTPGVRTVVGAESLMDFYDELFDATDGAVNPLIGQTLSDLGYDADYSLRAVPDPAPVQAWSSVVHEGPRIATTAPALIDVGAAGKGRLVDLIAGLLWQAGAHEATLDASGDIYHRGTTPIRVALEHPRDRTRALGVVHLDSEHALCGSASNRRAWGDGLHHVLDGRTGRPTSDIVATWVLVPQSCMIADGLATAHYFAEPDRLLERWDHQFVRMHADGRVVWSPDLPGEVFA
ncbi:MAG: FAD:protein FMN transferase [Aeromicrobium sp.]|uniref:FAD:protein FMN transferase n=1 Tax=Aeromicrobium sp. TaxID=1871063 RepID=UPI003C388D75